MAVTRVSGTWISPKSVGWSTSSSIHDVECISGWVHLAWAFWASSSCHLVCYTIAFAQCWFIIKCFAVVETRIALSDLNMKVWIFPTHPNLLEFHFQELPITNLTFPTGLDTSSQNIALYLASIHPQTNKIVITQNHHYLFMIMLEVEILSQVFTDRLSTPLYDR